MPVNKVKLSILSASRQLCGAHIAVVIMQVLMLVLYSEEAPKLGGSVRSDVYAFLVHPGTILVNVILMAMNETLRRGVCERLQRVGMYVRDDNHLFEASMVTTLAALFAALANSDVDGNDAYIFPVCLVMTLLAACYQAYHNLREIKARIYEARVVEHHPVVIVQQ